MSRFNTLHKSGAFFLLGISLDVTKRNTFKGYLRVATQYDPDKGLHLGFRVASHQKYQTMITYHRDGQTTKLTLVNLLYIEMQ